MDLLHNKYYKAALEYISRVDLDKLPTGKHVLDGDNLFVNVVDSQLKTPSEARLEVHNLYIDVQVPLSGPETYGVKDRSGCTSAAGEFNEEKDIQFFNDPVEHTVSAVPGQPVTFTPDVAHAPLIGSGTLRKAIFKVKVI